MLTLADTKRLPDIYEAEIQRIEMDYDVQMAEALADWRAYVEKKNDACLGRGLVRPTRRRFDAGNLMLAVGGVFLASVIAGVLLDPADASFIAAARDLVPAMADRLEAQEALLREAMEALERCPPTSNPTLTAEYNLERIEAWWRLEVRPVLAKLRQHLEGSHRAEK